MHRIEPVFAYGNAPLIPALARVEGFDVLHLHYPFIFGSELTLLGRLRRARRKQALVVHYKNRLVANGVRGALFEAYEHTVGPALIAAADRVGVLSMDHAESVSYLRRARRRDPSKLTEMPNGIDSEVFSPGPDDGLRDELGIPPMPLVAAFVATLDKAHHFKRLDVAIEARGPREPRDPSGRRRRGRAARGLPRARGHGRRRRAGPLPRRGSATPISRACCAPRTSSCSPPSRRSRSASS